MMLIREATILSAYLLCTAIDVSLLGSHHFPLANGQMVPELASSKIFFTVKHK